MRLIARALDAAAFAPFGEVTPRPSTASATVIAPIGGFQNLRPQQAVPRLAWFAVSASPWPITALVMERHQHSSQSFAPCAGGDWLVLVAPHDASGGPDMARALAFVAGQDDAVTLRPDTWHHPLTAIAAAQFAVLTSLAGDAEDDEFRTLATPVRVAGPSPARDR